MDSGRQPGDLLLDRYLPDAVPEVRDEARARLYGYVRVLLKIADRLEREAREAVDSLDRDGRLRMVEPPSHP